jgi:DNA-binding NarL/FixJ family response regulator
MTLSRFTGALQALERRAPDPALPRLLLVDDDPLVLAALRRNLIRTFQVVCAEGGRAAIDLLERVPVDFIATDLNMPEVSGLDLYRHVAKAAPGLERRLIFFSGAHPSPEFRGFLEASGMICLAKPFTSQHLIDTIERVIAKKG